jgi:hypothetical protein
MLLFLYAISPRRALLNAYLFLLLFFLAALPGPAGTCIAADDKGAVTATMTIQTAIPGDAELWITDPYTGKMPWMPIKVTMPATVEVPGNRTYSIRVVRYEHFIFRHTGVKRGVAATTVPIEIDLHREIALERIFAVLIVLVVLIEIQVLGSRRRKVRLLQRERQKDEEDAREVETVINQARELGECTQSDPPPPGQAGH